MIIFSHLSKTAGTTFNYILRNNFGTLYDLVIPIYGFRDYYNKPTFTREDLEIYKKFNPYLSVISGHYIKPYVFKKYKNDFVLTFLRDPMKRFVSGYNHCFNKNLINCSIEDWINNSDQHNYQTKFICGSENLDQAIKIINNEIDFVGLVEQFDKSLIIFNKMLSNKLDIRYQRKNINDNKMIKFNKLNHAIKNKIKTINSLDIELYNFVKKEVFKNYDNKCKDLDEKLAEFELINNKYKFNKFRINQYRIAHYFYYIPLARISKFFLN